MLFRTVLHAYFSIVMNHLLVKMIRTYIFLTLLPYSSPQITCFDHAPQFAAWPIVCIIPRNILIFVKFNLRPAIHQPFCMGI